MITNSKLVIVEVSLSFPKVDLNKFLHDVQSNVNLICAKFGKDLFSISKVIGLKQSGPCFLAYPVFILFYFIYLFIYLITQHSTSNIKLKIQ